MTKDTLEEYERWLATRPESVQKLAREFPPGSIIIGQNHDDCYVLGWNEDDQLIVSTIDPGEDYDRAMETKQYLCAQHIRDHLLEVKDRD